MGTPGKPPVIGKKMGEAWTAVAESDGGIPEITLARMFSWAVVERIIKANLVKVKVTNVGRVLIADKPEKRDNRQPLEGYGLKGHIDGLNREQIIEHNSLAVVCPVCESAAGRNCISTKTLAEVRFPHFERIKEAVYVLSILVRI